jgi:hypothetical protein
MTHAQSNLDVQHQLTNRLTEARARTATRMLRRSFRNWFQPRYPFVYAKFCCVLDPNASIPLR